MRDVWWWLHSQHGGGAAPAASSPGDGQLLQAHIGLGVAPLPEAKRSKRLRSEGGQACSPQAAAE